MHGGHGRLLKLPEMEHRPHEQGGWSSPGMACLHRLDKLGEARTRATAYVVTGAESPTVGLQDDHLDRIVGLGVLQAVFYVPDHLGALGVGLLRPVEDDPGYRAVL